MRIFRLPSISAPYSAIVFTILLAAALGCAVTGCTRTSHTSGGEPIAQSVRAPMPTTRGDNLFEKSRTKVFPAVFLPKDAVVIEDKWLEAPPEGEEADLAYYIGEQRFDNVVKVIAHLDTLDTETLAPGLILIQADKDYRPGWKDDVNQLCIFAEFQNINLWFRAPAQYGHDREAESAAWFVREMKEQVQDRGADDATTRDAD